MTATHWPGSAPTLRDSWLTRLADRLTPVDETQEPWQARPLSLARHLDPEAGIEEPLHLRAIEDAIIAAIDGTGPRRIIINMPPQHGKTQTVSNHTPVWYLDRNPEKLVVLASYQTGYASLHSMKVRDTIKRHHETLRVKVRSDVEARSNWMTTAGGGMVAQGLHGSFTGRKGDFVIVDDPVKNAREAMSPTSRQAVWDWYESTIETRMAPDGILVIVMTRWHEDDLVGRILERDGEEAWKVLRFPAIAVSEDDELGREIGEPLWPERYDLGWLIPIRQRNEYLWNGMYQQRPVQPSGAIIKRDWYLGRRNRYDWAERYSYTQSRYISIDTAESDSPTSAWTVAVIAEYTHDKRLRGSGVERVRLEPADLSDWVKRLIDTYDFDFKLAGIIIEAKSTGVSLISTLRRILPSRYRKLIFTYRPRDSKDERLRRAASWMKNGSYLLPFVSENAKGLEWLGDYEQELFGAPMSRFRDQADATAQIIIYLESYLEQGLLERSQRAGYREVA